MTRRPYLAAAGCQFAAVDVVDISSHGYQCQRRSYCAGKAVSRAVLACHQSGNLIVYAKELA
jgi:hypothetical protein